MIISEKFWTLPNAISLFRLLFGALITIWLYKNGFGFAWLVFLFFVFTDFLDGFIARRQNTGSSWGMALDPLADQFLVLPIFWMFYWAGDISLFAPMLLTIREILMVLLRLSAKRDISANILGKAKVVAEYAGISFLLAGAEWNILGLMMFLPILFLAAASLLKYAYDVFGQKCQKGSMCS
ncbi:MAG: CDP-alcohol phosphatidyltransferase family protein [bacterium]|nr:CDP-alcohol phosphatidyltransferase family protein [bacterium]